MSIAASTSLVDIHCFVASADVVATIPVNRYWAEVGASDMVWAAQCTSLWSDKVYVPDRFTNVEPPTGLRRIAAYWRSLADSRRVALTAEEICSFDWSTRMKQCAGGEWLRSDPWWQTPPQKSSVRRYNDDGTTSSSKGAGTWRFVPDSCGKTGPIGCFVRHARGTVEFPTHFVTRWKANWGWILQNCWGFSASFGLPPRGAVPELEDDSPLCQSVTVETCRDEATLFNVGLPLPHALHDPVAVDLADNHELVELRVNGRRRNVRRDVLLAMLQEEDVDQDDNDDPGNQVSAPVEDAAELRRFVDDEAEEAEGGESEESLETEREELSESEQEDFPVKLGRVRLLGSEDEFRVSFRRFLCSDDLNGFSEEKLARLGQEATVTEVFGDRTCTCVFQDGVSYDFPMETIEEQICVAEA